MRIPTLKRDSDTKLDRTANPPKLKFQIKTDGWTPEKRAEEFEKCKRDPVYWMENYGVIQHPVRGKIPFHLYPFQKDLVRSMFDFKNVLVLKSRQMGISTLVSAFACWLTMFYSDKRVLVIATKAETAKNFLEKAIVCYQYTPRWMKPKARALNRMSIMFGNGSSVKVSTTTEDAARSEALSLLIIDEAAFIREMREIIGAAAPTLSTGGKLVALSTPNGPQGWFYETYLQTVSQDTDEPGLKMNNYHLVTLPWDLHPERDQAWFDVTCKTLNNDRRKIAQEYLCDFAASGDKVLSPDVIDFYRKDKRRKPRLADSMDVIDKIIENGMDQLFQTYRVNGEDSELSLIAQLRAIMENDLYLYKVPGQNDDFFGGVDTASGSAGDFSAFQIYDLTGVMACSFKSKLDSRLYAMILYLVGLYYNSALLGIETGPYGSDVIIRLRDELNYMGVVNGLKRKKPGFSTNGETRSLYIARAVSWLSNPTLENRPILNDLRVIEEWDVFVWKGHRPEADKGLNDDAVMAQSIAATMLTMENLISSPLLGLFKEAPALPSGDFGSIDTSKEALSEEYNERVEAFKQLNAADDPRLENMKNYWNQFGIEHGTKKKKRDDAWQVTDQK